MKYKNVEIGDKPTKEQFQEYVSRNGFNIDVTLQKVSPENTSFNIIKYGLENITGKTAMDT